MGDDEFDNFDPETGLPDAVIAPIEPQAAEQADPFAQAIEGLSYANEEQARDGLVKAIRYVQAHDKNLADIAAEQARTQELIANFEKREPEIAKDQMAQAAAKVAIVAQQRADLVRVGAYDPKKFREEFQRDPSDDEIMQSHLAFRAAGDKRVKSAQQMLDGALDTLETKFGIRRRGPSEDDSRSSVVQRRVNAERQRRGLEPLPPDAPVKSHRRLDISASEFTAQVGFGQGVGEDSTSQADSLDASRSRRAQEMVAARQSGRNATLYRREPGK
jgi:hypothetical protein